MKNKIFIVLALLLSVVANGWADETFTFNSDASTSDAKFPVGAALSNYTYGTYGASHKLISLAANSSLTFRNPNGYVITSATVEGVAANNDPKDITITLSDGTTTATTGENTWNDRKSDMSSFALKIGGSTDLSTLAHGANQSYTVAVTGYAVGIHLIITYVEDGSAPSNPVVPLEGAWSSGTVNFAYGSVPTIPVFSITTDGATTDHYTVTYSKVADANNIVTLDSETGITAINTSSAGSTATVRATVALTATGEEAYTLSTSTYDCVLSVGSPETPDDGTSDYPDANYMEMDRLTSAGSITFEKSSTYSQGKNACRFYGKDYAKGLKQEKETSTTFTTTETSTITIAQPLTTNPDKTILMDGTELSQWNGCTVTSYPDKSDDNYRTVKVYKIINVPAGTHVVKQGNGQSYIAYIGVTYGETNITTTTATAGTSGQSFYVCNTTAVTALSNTAQTSVTFKKDDVTIGTLTGYLKNGSSTVNIGGTDYTFIKAGASNRTYELTPANGITLNSAKLYITSNSADDAKGNSGKTCTVTVDGTSTVTAKKGETPTEVDITAVDGKIAFTIGGDNNEALLVLVVNYDKAETINVDVSTAGYATLFYAGKLAIPEGVTVYTGKVSDDKTQIELSVVDGVIPANTGVILKADAGTYTFAVTTADAASIVDNDLEGTTVEKDVTGDNVYTLGKNAEGVVGLRHYTGTSLRAYSAYMAGSKFGGNQAPAFMSLGVGLDNTTGIEAVTPVTQKTGVRKYVKDGRIVIETAKGVFTLTGTQVQ